MSTAIPSTAGGRRTEDVETFEHQRRAFQLHKRVFAAVMPLIFVVNLLVNVAADITRDLGAWWSGWALIGWGVGIAVHGIVVRMARPEGLSRA